jgi:hypothetical protein
MNEDQARKICKEKLGWPNLHLIRVTKELWDQAAPLMGVSRAPFEGEHWQVSSTLGRIAKLTDDGEIKDLTARY